MKYEYMYLIFKLLRTEILFATVLFMKKSSSKIWTWIFSPFNTESCSEWRFGLFLYLCVSLWPHKVGAYLRAFPFQTEIYLQLSPLRSRNKYRSRPGHYSLKYKRHDSKTISIPIEPPFLYSSHRKHYLTNMLARKLQFLGLFESVFCFLFQTQIYRSQSWKDNKTNLKMKLLLYEILIETENLCKIL